MTKHQPRKYRVRNLLVAAGTGLAMTYAGTASAAGPRSRPTPDPVRSGAHHGARVGGSHRVVFGVSVHPGQPGRPVYGLSVHPRTPGRPVYGLLVSPRAPRRGR